MADIKTQTKIAVLIEKINYLFQSIQQHGGAINSIDKDLMMSYVRELYELTMSLQPDNPQQQMPSHQINPYPQQQMYPQNQQQMHPPAQPLPQQPFQNQGYQVQPQENNGYHPPQQQTNFPMPGQGQSIQQSYSGMEQKKTLADLYSIKTGKEYPSVNERQTTAKTELADKLKKTPIKDLKVFIGLNKRFSYINFLFNNNSRLYEEAIEKINSSKNYDEALSYIESEIAPKFKWQLEDEMVVEFYNIVERRFLI